MPTINQLSSTDTLSGNDLAVIYSANNGDDRKISITNFLNYFKESFTAPDFITTITAAVNGQTVSMTDDSTNQWALLSPAGTIATATIVFPISTGLVDGQEIIVTSSQTITALTINGNGSTVSGGPTTIGATSPMKMKYNVLTTSWHKVV